MGAKSLIGAGQPGAVTVGSFVNCSANGLTDQSNTDQPMTLYIDGTFSNFSAYASSTGGTMVLRRNGTDTSCVLSINATSSWLVDAVNTQTYGSGDTLNFRTNGATPGLRSIFGQYENNGTVGQQWLGCGGGQSFTTTAGLPIPIVGRVQTSFTDGTAANNGCQFQSNGTFSHLEVRIAQNTSSGGTFALWKNGSAGSISISIGSAATGVFSNLTDTESCTAGDYFNFHGKLTSASGSMLMRNSAVRYTSSNNDTEMMAGFGQNHSYVGGYQLFGEKNNSSQPIRMPFAGTASNCRVYVQTAAAGVGTQRFRINSSNGNQVFTIGSNVTGWVSDAVNTDVFSAADAIQTTGSGSTRTTNNPGVTIRQPASSGQKQRRIFMTIG